MALPTSGKTYRFNNVGASSRRLNLFSSGSASDGMNVVLYTADLTNEQQWVYQSNRLYIKTNTAYCLDRFTGSASPNNADIYLAASNYDADQKITFVADGDYVKIKLSSASLYLTAVSNANGTSSGKSSTSAGNVYWAAASTSNLQKWSFSEVSSGGSLTNNYVTYPVTTMNITQNTSDGNHASYSSGSPVDYPIDEACADTGRSYLYCPCNEMEVVRVYGVGTTGVNTIWLTSTSNAVMPCGTAKLTMMVMHPNDDDLGSISVGKKYTRGQAMFREGGDGASGSATFGNHFHISCGKGTISGNGWTQNTNSAWVLATTGGTIRPEKAFYRDPNFTTTIKNSKGITFPTLP